MWISRHGTASDEDEMIWNNFDCGETVRLIFTALQDTVFVILVCAISYHMNILIFQTDDYICKDEHIHDKGIDQDGRVCHCFQDLCNNEAPNPKPDPDPTNSPSPSTTCQTSCTTTCS